MVRHLILLRQEQSFTSDGCFVEVTWQGQQTSSHCFMNKNKPLPVKSFTESCLIHQVRFNISHSDRTLVFSSYSILDCFLMCVYYSYHGTMMIFLLSVPPGATSMLLSGTTEFLEQGKSNFLSGSSNLLFPLPEILVSQIYHVI